MSLKNSGIPSYTWAAKPAIANWPAKRPVLISDLGTGAGVLFAHDGANWRPVGGQFVLAQQSGTRAAPVDSKTGTSGTFTLSGGTPGILIPAGLLIAGRSEILLEARFNKVDGAAGTGAACYGTVGTTNNPTTDNLIFGVQTANPANGQLRAFFSGNVDPNGTSFLADVWLVPGAAANAMQDRITNFDVASNMYVNFYFNHTGVGTETTQLLSYLITIKQ